MGDNIEKNNINLLPEDLKKNQVKKVKKEVEDSDIFEPDLVLPDSEKLKKQKTTGISGSEVSFFEKIANWFGSKFNKVSHKEPEVPRIQELQEMIGKKQHVGEVLIDDEEVIPDKERDRVVTQESIKKEEIEEATDKYPVKEKEDVIFVTKEDHEAELAKQKEPKKEENKIEPIPINQDDRGLKRDKKIDVPESDDGVYSMPQSLADINLPEPEEDMVNEESSKSTIMDYGIEDSNNKIKTSVSGPSWWDKVKMFFTGIFAGKVEENKKDKDQENSSVLLYELNKAADREKEEKDDSYELSTPAENFSQGIKSMPFEPENKDTDANDKPEEKEENVFDGSLDKGIKNEELSKAQEELLSEPEDLSGVEDIFSTIEQKEEKAQELSEDNKKEKDSLWEKIKHFFSGLFSPKPKEVSMEKIQPEVEVQPEPEVEVQPEPEVEVQPEPEVELKGPIEKVQLTGPLDQGRSESLPTSLTEPTLNSDQDMALLDNNEDLAEKEKLGVEKNNIGLWSKIKAFFAHIFSPKAKEVDLNQESPEQSSEAVNRVDGEMVSTDGQGLVELGDAQNEVSSDTLKQTQEIDEYELATKFHQPQMSTVTRLIDQEGGVDLIPVAVRTKSWPQIIQLLVAAVVGSVIILGSFYAILYIQQDRLETAKILKESQISTVEKTILDYEGVNKEIESLGLEIETVYNLINKHVYWTNLFTMIERYTISDVYYNGFVAGNGGALSLSATGKDYDAAARQLKLLQSEEAKEFIKSVTINSVGGGESGVNFSINLVLNDNIFYYDHTKVLWIVDLPVKVNEEDPVEMAFRQKIDEFRTAIKDKGYQFFLATSVGEGLALAEKENVDVILLDIGLPEEPAVENVSALDIPYPVEFTEDEYAIIQKGYTANNIARLEKLLKDKEIKIDSGLLGISVNGQVFKIYTSEDRFGEPEIKYYSTKMVKLLNKSAIVRGASIIILANQDQQDEIDEAKEFGSAGYIYNNTEAEDMFYIVSEELKFKNKYLQ